MQQTQEEVGKDRYELEKELEEAFPPKQEAELIKVEQEVEERNEQHD